MIPVDERLQVDCDHRLRIEDMQSLNVRLPTLNKCASPDLEQSGKLAKRETLSPPA